MRLPVGMNIASRYCSVPKVSAAECMFVHVRIIQIYECVKRRVLFFSELTLCVYVYSCCTQMSRGMLHNYIGTFVKVDLHPAQFIIISDGFMLYARDCKISAFTPENAEDHMTVVRRYIVM